MEDLMEVQSDEDTEESEYETGAQVTEEIDIIMTSIIGEDSDDDFFHEYIFMYIASIGFDRMHNFSFTPEHIIGYAICWKEKCGGSNPHMKKAYEGNPGKGSTQAEL